MSCHYYIYQSYCPHGYAVDNAGLHFKLCQDKFNKSEESFKNTPVHNFDAGIDFANRLRYTCCAYDCGCTKQIILTIIMCIQFRRNYDDGGGDDDGNNDGEGNDNDDTNDTDQACNVWNFIINFISIYCMKLMVR